MTVGRLRRALLLIVVVLVVLVGALAAAAGPGRLAAEGRAAVVLAGALDIPAAGWVVRQTTDKPERLEITLAGAPTTVVRPGGNGDNGSGRATPRSPALVFLTGASPEGRNHPRLLAAADGLARSGYVVFIPDIEGLRDGTVGAEAVDLTVEVCLAAAERPESAEGQVALASVSVGASLALLAAQDAQLDGEVSAVAGIAPFAHLRTVLQIATTGTYRDSAGNLRRFEPDPFLRVVVARSLLASLPQSERELLAPYLDTSDDSRDPFAPLRERARQAQLESGSSGASALGSRSTAASALLVNSDPQHFDELYDALPAATRAELARLSPLTRAETLDMPVELATPPQDKYFPTSESVALAKAAPHGRVTVTSTLDHAIPEASLDELRDLAQFHDFVLRFLEAAR